MYTAPEVSESRPARQCIRVLLPEPDGPMIAVNLPASKATVTPSRARTSLSPLAVDLDGVDCARGGAVVSVCVMVYVVATLSVVRIRGFSDVRPAHAGG